MNSIKKFFYFMSDLVVQVRKAKAEVIARRIGR
jgi:hypothetical protein